MQEMGHNGSRGRPESVAPEFCTGDEQKWNYQVSSPPKVAENWQLAVSSFHDMATFVPVWPDWLEFDDSEGVESIQDALVSHM